LRIVKRVIFVFLSESPFGITFKNPHDPILGVIYLQFELPTNELSCGKIKEFEAKKTASELIDKGTEVIVFACTGYEMSGFGKHFTFRI